MQCRSNHILKISTQPEIANDMCEFTINVVVKLSYAVEMAEFLDQLAFDKLNNETQAMLSITRSCEVGLIAKPSTTDKRNDVIPTPRPVHLPVADEHISRSICRSIVSKRCAKKALPSQHSQNIHA
jgi:hypothetical protein